MDGKSGFSYWEAFRRVNQRQTRLKQIQEDMMIRLAAETLGKEIPLKTDIESGGRKDTVSSV